MTAILGNVHDDVVTSTVTIPPAGTGSPTPDLAAPSTAGSLQMVTARQRQPREYPPLGAVCEVDGILTQLVPVDCSGGGPELAQAT